METDYKNVKGIITNCDKCHKKKQIRGICLAIGSAKGFSEEMILRLSLEERGLRSSRSGRESRLRGAFGQRSSPYKGLAAGKVVVH